MVPYFMNVDLEIVARSESKLKLLARAVEKSATAIYLGPGVKGYMLSLETRDDTPNPDATIRSLCAAIESLPAAARRIWDASRKCFDIGFEVPAPQRAQFALRKDTVARIAKLGATVAVTWYPPNISTRLDLPPS